MFDLVNKNRQIQKPITEQNRERWIKELERELLFEW